MRITQSQNNQIPISGTEATSADKIGGQESQQPLTGQTESKPASKSESSFKKAELGIAGQAQAASLNAKTDKAESARWKMGPDGGLYPNLERGSTGKEVLALQKRLNEYRREKNLPEIKEDGVFGTKTEKAVSDYQDNVYREYKGFVNGESDEKFLDPSSVAGPSTWKSLGATPRFQYGCEGEGVRELQKGLNEYRRSKGLPEIKEDGKYRSETETAVRQYQNDHKKEGMKVDGKVGTETIRSLDEEVGIKNVTEQVDPAKVQSDQNHKVDGRPPDSAYGNGRKTETESAPPQSAYGHPVKTDGTPPESAYGHKANADGTPPGSAYGHSKEEDSIGDSTKMGGLTYDDVKEIVGSNSHKVE